MTIKLIAFGRSILVFGLLLGSSLPSGAQSLEPVDPMPLMEGPMQPSEEPSELIYSPEPVPVEPASDYAPPGYLSPDYAPPEYVPQAATSELCGPHNTAEQAQSFVVGDRPDVPYVVVVPGSGDELLNSVRQCVVDAYQTEGGRGDYIRAGAFADRRSAEQLSRHLRSLDLDARVVYLP